MGEITFDSNPSNADRRGTPTSQPHSQHTKVGYIFFSLFSPLQSATDLCDRDNAAIKRSVCRVSVGSIRAGVQLTALCLLK